jgi:hypothetical protein
MRVLVVVLAVLGTIGVAACGDDSRPCSGPLGCVSAARVDGTCACVEWETVSTETVALPFVVTSVDYWPVGNASVFRYGHTWDPAMVPASASSMGTTFRAVIRRADGSEQVARLGNVEEGFSAGTPLTDSAVRIAAGGVWTLTTDVDLSSRSDSISVWVNPEITVATNYVGEKTVSWSSRNQCFWPGLDCSRPQLAAFSTALLRGETSWDPVHDAYLEQLGPEGRASLLAFDPRAVGAAVELPRYQRLSDLTVGAAIRDVDASWRPCLDANELEVVAETAVPLERGDTFVLQYGVLPEAACALQSPGLLVGTTTPDCEIAAQLYVDRLSGTLLMQASAATGPCTTE